MGSGLILLVIVAAWLAVLVPMALRSHESSSSQSSVERFSDAMRVLSRRDAAARVRARLQADDPLSAAAYAQGQDDEPDWDDVGAPSRWRERLAAGRHRAVSLAGRVRSRGSGRRPSTPAVRRRRLLVTLVLLLAGCLAGGIVGPSWLLAVAGGLLLATALFVVQLRRLARRRAAVLRPSTAVRRQAQSAAPPRRRPVRPAAPVAPAAAEPVGAGSVRVQPASVPVPVHEEPVHEPVHERPLPAAAAAESAVPPVRQTIPAQHSSPAPAAALGEAWSPVPVPVPTYVTAPVAPERAARIVDLTRPGAWTQPEPSRPPEALPGTAPLPERVPERRRAVNEW